MIAKGSELQVTRSARKKIPGSFQTLVLEIGGTHLEGVSNAQAIAFELFIQLSKLIIIFKNYLKISYLRVIDVVDIDVRKQIWKWKRNYFYRSKINDLTFLPLTSANRTLNTQLHIITCGVSDINVTLHNAPSVGWLFTDHQQCSRQLLLLLQPVTPRWFYTRKVQWTIKVRATNTF